jgi:hypothetical protein
MEKHFVKLRGYFEFVVKNLYHKVAQRKAQSYTAYEAGRLNRKQTKH